MYKAIRRWKGVKIHTIAVGVELGEEECEKNPQKRELYAQGRNSKVPHYHPPKRKYKFRKTLTTEWNGYSDTTGGP